MEKFVYYADEFNDGGFIEVSESSGNEVKHPIQMGINLFSDDEISNFLKIYRKNSFHCWSDDPNLIAETKRLAEKFGLAAQIPS